MTWQAERVKTRAPRERFPGVPPGAVCIECGHTRASHSALIMFAPCHVARCDCPAADFACGCGHPLGVHMWSTPPTPFACSLCICKGFGARMPEIVQQGF